MASPKSQAFENKAVQKTWLKLGRGEKKDAKMKVLPDIFMKTHEIQN